MSAEHDPFSQPRPKQPDLFAEPIVVPAADPGCCPTHDPDGVYVPLSWRFAYEKWCAFSLPQRRHLSKGRELSDNPLAKQTRTTVYAPRFTTQYSIDWAKRQGWKLIDRERYDYRTKRNHDLEGMVDAIFEVPGLNGRTGIQGAGRYERKSHFEKFERWGGREKAERRGLKVIYQEWEKGSKKEPALQEVWA